MFRSSRFRRSALVGSGLVAGFLSKAAADAAPGPAAAAAGYYDVPPGVRESTPRSIYHVSSGSQPLYGSSSAAAPASWRPRAQTDANGLRN